MKSNELMIGDWVRVNRDGLCIKKDTIVQVRGIDGDDKIEEKGLFGAAHCRPLDEVQFDGGIWLDYLDPIPLTPEILEKNGFVKTIHQDLYKNTYRLDRFFIHEHHNKVKFPYYWIDLGDTDIKYVHELQHALRLCGIDKEITI